MARQVRQIVLIQTSVCRVGSFAGNNRIHWADLSHHPFGQECTEPRTSIKIDPVADRVCFFLSPLHSLTSTIPITTYSGERFSSDPLLHPVAHSSVQFFIFFGGQRCRNAAVPGGSGPAGIVRCWSLHFCAELRERTVALCLVHMSSEPETAGL